jgi:hemerythrin-like domain-containing protein
LSRSFSPDGGTLFAALRSCRVARGERNRKSLCAARRRRFITKVPWTIGTNFRHARGSLWKRRTGMATRPKQRTTKRSAPKRATAAQKIGAKDAIALLKADHDKVRRLLSELEQTTDRSAKTREKLLREIETELKIHEQIEEEIFYPAYRDAVSSKEDRKFFYEAHEEHHTVDLVLPELLETDPATEVFGAKAKVLKELVEHHADEEEQEMFTRARKAMRPQELRELGDEMQRRKQELIRSNGHSDYEAAPIDVI